MLKYTDYNIVFQEVPDEVTLALNISGCPNMCQGCHSPWLWEDIGIALTSEGLAGLLQKYGNGVTCVCFMGGDSEPDEIERLALFVRTLGAKNDALEASGNGRGQTALRPQSMTEALHPSWKTAWYSGRQTLPEGFLTSSFDYIKLGPYISTLGPLRSRTTNQRLYKVSPIDGLTDITARFWK